MKYALLDAEDIALVDQYTFEARIEVDADGDGVRIVGWAYKLNESLEKGKYLHDLIWELRRGVPQGYFYVTHKNKITLDNRMENLTLARRQDRTRRHTALTTKRPRYLPPAAESSPHKTLDQTDSDSSIYTLAMQRLPVDNGHEIGAKLFSTNGLYIDESGKC